MTVQYVKLLSYFQTSPFAGGQGSVRVAAKVDDDDGAAVGADDQKGGHGVRGGAQVHTG